MGLPGVRLKIRSAFPALTAYLLLALSTGAQAEDPTWRQVDPENLVFMDLHDGQVVIELNPAFAPKTVKQFRQLVKDGFYDGLSFYRVIDGFVAQGGDGSDLGELSEVPLIDAEFEREWSPDLPFVPVQKPDMFAPETGFTDGFAAARDPAGNTIWLIHCPGVVAMARNEDPDSSRTDFYIVMGQAPRYLDRNMNVFGRVIHGMELVQAIRRGAAGNDGIVVDETAASRMRRVRLGSEMPDEERPEAYVMDTGSKGFEDLLHGRRDRTQRFFHNKPPGVLDVCQVPMAGRITK
jgi:peptidylprolyl isomerase